MEKVDWSKIITDDMQIAKVLNDFFSNMIKTLNISQTNHSDSNFRNIRSPTLTGTLKYRSQPRILARKERLKCFGFYF